MPIELSHDHVAIRAVDYAGTVAWYRDKLDFTVDQEWPFRRHGQFGGRVERRGQFHHVAIQVARISQDFHGAAAQHV